MKINIAAEVRPVLPVLPVTPMSDTKTVKKSISMPVSLWAYVEQKAEEAGHGMDSRVLHDAIRRMMRADRKRKVAPTK